MATYKNKITYYDYLLSYRRQLRQKMTKSETVLWKHIKGNHLGYKFRRQYSVGNYIADFASAKIKLVIEVDGFTHADESVFEKDQKKENFLKENGYTVKRYSSEQVFKNLDDVLADIYEICKELSERLSSPS